MGPVGKRERYQSLALHQSDLSPEVGDGHGDGFPIESI